MVWTGENQAGKRHASESRLTRHRTLHMPNVFHFRTHRETERSWASGLIFSPVSSVRSSQKMWCCLVLVLWFAAVTTWADRQDLQTSIPLILSIYSGSAGQREYGHQATLLTSADTVLSCLPLFATKWSLIAAFPGSVFLSSFFQVYAWHEHSWVPGFFLWLSCKLTSEPGFWFSLAVHPSCSFTQ